MPVKGCPRGQSGLVVVLARGSHLPVFLDPFQIGGCAGRRVWLSHSWLRAGVSNCGRSAPLSPSFALEAPTDLPELVGGNAAGGPDHSVFVGDLAPDVTDYVLQENFRQFFPSVRSAKVNIYSRPAYIHVCTAFASFSSGRLLHRCNRQPL